MRGGGEREEDLSIRTTPQASETCSTLTNVQCLTDLTRPAMKRVTLSQLVPAKRWAMLSPCLNTRLRRWEPLVVPRPRSVFTAVCWPPESKRNGSHCGPINLFWEQKAEKSRSVPSDALSPAERGDPDPSFSVSASDAVISLCCLTLYSSVSLH